MNERLYAIALAAIVALGTALRLLGIDTQSLSFDEGATLFFARLPIAELWGPAAVLETNPPLFYMIEHAAVALLGEADGTLRLPSVLAGALTIPVVAWVARWFGGPGAGLLAAALLATSPIDIITSQDARAYAALELAGLLAIAAVLWVTERARLGRGPGGGWVVFVAAAVAALYLHNTAVLMLAGLACMLLVGWAGLGWAAGFARSAGLALAVIAACWVPWVPVVLAQTQGALASFWLAVPGLTDLRYAVMNVYAQPEMRYGQPGPDALFLGLGALGVVVARQRMLWALAACLVVGVPVASWAISQWRPIMNGKTLLWLLPVFLVLVAIGTLRLRWLGWPVAAALLAIQTVACVSYYETRWDEGYDAAALVLAREGRTGDTVYLDPATNEVLLRHYGWTGEGQRVLAPDGPRSYFSAYQGAAAVPGVAAAAGRLWVLTRTNDAVQRAAAALPMRRVRDDVFGSGLWRKKKLRTLELSLFEPG